MPHRFLRLLLWLLVAVLCGFGLVMVASTTAGMQTQASGGLNLGFLVKQSGAMAVGLILAVAISMMGTRRLANPWVVAAVGALCLGSLLVVHVVGRQVNGARRWIDLGPVKFQPAEFAKLAVVLIAAWHLARVAERVRVHWYGVLLPTFAFAVVAVLVYMTKDLGSVVVMGVVLGAMFFFAGAPWFYSMMLGLGTLPVLLYTAVFQVSYRRDRMLAFLDPWNAEGPAGYHLRQSYIAIGSGGLTGLGLGQGHVRMAFLPEHHTDFIFAIIAQELGLVGAVSVAFVILLLIATGLLIANGTRDRHQRLLAVGATMVLGTQAFWNMLVVTGAVPTKGLTLPFISYGGSSVMICLSLVGLLDAVARSPRREAQRTSTTRIGAAVVGQRSWLWESEEPITEGQNEVFSG